MDFLEVDPLDLHCNAAVFVGELECVRQEVEQDLLVAAFVAVNALDVVEVLDLAYFGDEIDALLLGTEQQHLKRLLNRGWQIGVRRGKSKGVVF